jgi:ribosomal protein S6--L-glutamate ligase
MKIGVLSRRASLYSTRRLVEAARDRDHEVHVINYLRCYMDIAAHKPQVMFKGEPVSGFDAIIPRIGASNAFYGAAVIRQFEMMGTFSANESIAINRAHDKLRQLQLLARAGVGLPVTGYAHDIQDIDGIIESVGGAPLVVKLLQGTQGKGVVLAETRKAAESVIGAFRELDANILVQEFIKEAKGSDIRAFVVGNRVIAAMQRQAPPGEFRSNIHRGGVAEKIKLTPEERSTAVRSAKRIGLNVAGVDMMRSNHGPVVLEVNSSPGLEGIEEATGVDVAGKIIEFVEKNAKPTRTRSRAKG